MQPERVFLRYWLSDGIALCTPATQTSIDGRYYVFDLRALGAHFVYGPSLLRCGDITQSNGIIMTL